MSTITLPTKIHFLSEEEGRHSLIQYAFDHTTALFLSEKEAHDLGLLPMIETMEAQGKVNWIKVIPVTPSQNDVSAIMKTMISSEPELIVAIGSSAALNYAKLCSRFKQRPMMIAVPTSVDTISILLPWAAYRNNDEILSVTEGDSLAFDQALIMTDFTLKSSASVTLSASLKALAFAGDAYWAKTSTPTIRLWALQAIRLIVRNLPKALKNPELLNEHRSLLYGSIFASMAISNAKAGAISALSTSLAFKLGIDEGLAAAMVLPDLLRINLGDLSNPEALYDAFNINNPEALRAWIETLSEGISSLKLTEYGISESGVEALAEASMRLNTMANNPIEMNVDLVKTILKLHL